MNIPLSLPFRYSPSVFVPLSNNIFYTLTLSSHPTSSALSTGGELNGADLEGFARVERILEHP